MTDSSAPNSAPRPTFTTRVDRLLSELRGWLLFTRPHGANARLPGRRRRGQAARDARAGDGAPRDSVLGREGQGPRRRARLRRPSPRPPRQPSEPSEPRGRAALHRTRAALLRPCFRHGRRGRTLAPRRRRPSRCDRMGVRRPGRRLGQDSARGLRRLAGHGDDVRRLHERSRGTRPQARQAADTRRSWRARAGLPIPPLGARRLRARVPLSGSQADRPLLAMFADSKTGECWPPSRSSPSCRT